MKKKNLLLIILLGCYYVCFLSHAQRLPYLISLEKEIRNIKPTNLSEIGSSITYIPLETSDDCLLKSLRKVIVSDKHLLVSDADRILLFDTSGHFITEIGRKGQGPGEYIGWFDFCFSWDRSKIFILTNFTNRCLEYNLEGKFLNSFQIESLATKMRPLNDSLFVFHPTNQPLFDNTWEGSPNENSLIISDLYNNIEKTFKNHHKLAKTNFVMWGGSGAFYSFEGNIRFKEHGANADTLFTVTVNELIPYAVFDLGNKKMPVEIVVPNKSRPNAFDEALRPFQGKFFLASIREDSNNLYFRLSDWRNDLYGYYCKLSNSVFVIGEQGFQNDLDGGITFVPISVSYTDALVSWIDAYQLRDHVLNSDTIEMKKKYGDKSEVLIKLMNSLDDESNPVLILVNK